MHWDAERIIGSAVLRRKAKDWCHQHGIDPSLVPVDGRVFQVADDLIEVEVIKFNDPSRGSKFMLVNQVTPIPEDLLTDE